MFIKNITRNPFFWSIFIALSIVCTVFTIKYFSKSQSIINIDIKMDRHQALKEAEKLTHQQNLGPQNYMQAVSFEVDGDTKTFIELECGGKDAFVKMIKDGLYMPYRWIVRHFKEFEKNEVYIKFTHEGKPYGFKEVISDDATGADISKKEAQKIAEIEATTNWGINFNKYKLVESSKEIKQTKRSDHTFVYERTDAKLGENDNIGYYRLKILVTGDKVTALENFVKIPESFINKYKEMRSHNNTIAYIASFLLTILYLLGGCLVGLYFLFKCDYVIWKTPIVLAIFMAFLAFAERINVIPCAWMSYNTVSSSTNFLVSYLISCFITFLYKFFLFALTFMAAESLTRKAFGNHISLWKIWSKDNASSIAVAGRTVGGYLLATFMLAYVTGVYLITTNYFGWWTPASELVDPNILSHYLPWLNPFVGSFSAGFWEECLFRAVPLSCAALIGQKFGKKYWWIAFAFILQAIIFGAAHANYAAQPSYARLIELIAPSFMFASIFLAFGLLPSIITHFIYDLILMSIPLFVSSAKYAFVNQAAVILLGLIPIFIVLISKLRHNKWSEINNQYLNKYWLKPIEKVNNKPEPKEIIQTKISLNKKFIWPIFACAAVCLASYLYFTPFKHNAIKISLSQQEAVKAAQNGLKQRGLKIENWRAYPILSYNFDYAQYLRKPRSKYIKPGGQMQHKFIWQQDKNLYEKLLGKYLSEPQWIIRFVKFSGTQQERTEEYFAFINDKKELSRIYHKIPEDKKDQKLRESKARIIARTHIAQVLNLDPKSLNEITAKSKQLKDRINWKFVFADPNALSIDKTEARIVIKIDGDDVSDAYRYVNIPEDWIRDEKNKQNTLSILETIILLLFTFISMLTFIIVGMQIKQFSKKQISLGILTYCTASLLVSLNSISNIIANFDPIKPFYSQLLQSIGSMFISTLLLSVFFGIIFGIIIQLKNNTFFDTKRHIIFISSCAGIIFIGIDALVSHFKPSMLPLWPDYSNLSGYWPLINIIVGNTIKYLKYTFCIIIFTTALNYIYTSWERSFKYKYSLIIALFIISSFSLTDCDIDYLSFWAIKSLILAITGLTIYIFVARLDLRTTPFITATVIIFGLMRQIIFAPYQNILIYNIISILIIILLAVFLSRKINKA